MRKATDILRHMNQPEAEHEKQVAEHCGKCLSGKAELPHICPYQADIKGDTETLCNCCKDCQKECSDDV